jgi:hypothetical protein
MKQHAAILTEKEFCFFMWLFFCSIHPSAFRLSPEEAGTRPALEKRKRSALYFSPADSVNITENRERGGQSVPSSMSSLLPASFYTRGRTRRAAVLHGRGGGGAHAARARRSPRNRAAAVSPPSPYGQAVQHLFLSVARQRKTRRRSTGRRCFRMRTTRISTPTSSPLGVRSTETASCGGGSATMSWD